MVSLTIEAVVSLTIEVQRRRRPDATKFPPEGFRHYLCVTALLAEGDVGCKQPTAVTQPAPLTRLSTRDNAFRLQALPLAHVLWFSRLREASMGTGCPLDLVLF